MVKKTYLAKTIIEDNPNWPGTEDNPMRPHMYWHPIDKEWVQAHYNDRNLNSDRDYEDAGFEWIEGRGWCYPVDVMVPEDCTELNGIKL